ncbi:MAG: glycosyltransferase family 39 protein [Solirubrobacteraceae bacterium]
MSAGLSGRPAELEPAHGVPAPRAPAASTPRRRWLTLSARHGLLAGMIALAGVLRIAELGHQSFWYDESFTYLLVRHSFGHMLEIVPRTELTPPLYYILIWGWAQTFGTGEAALRTLSALAGVCTVPVMYLAVRRLITPRAGLVAAALTATNPLLIWYSREARSYALLVFGASVTLLALAHIRTPRPPGRWILAWALAAALTVATHYFGVLIVAPEAVWLLWRHRRDVRMWTATVAAAAGDLALLPLALTQRPNASWIAGWPLGRRLGQIPPQLLLGTGAPDRLPLLLTGAAVLALAGVLLAWRCEPGERGPALGGAALAVTGFLISLGLILAGIDELITRNLIVIMVGLIVLLAGTLGARRARRLGTIGAIVLCAIGGFCAVTVMLTPAFQRPDWRGLARVLASGSGSTGRAPGGGDSPAGKIVVIERYFAAAPLDVYMPKLRPMLPGDRFTVNEVDLVASASPPATWFCWWGAECNIKRSLIFRGIRLPGFRPATRLLHAGQFTILRLRSRVPRQLRWVRVFKAMVPSRLDGWAMLFTR